VRVHQYTGRENGIMIIGTRTDWRCLANQLFAATENAAKKKDAAWPPLIAKSKVSGRWDYSVSFHLETESGVPKDRLVFESEVVKILVRVFAIIGLVVSVRWAASFVL